MGDKFSKILKVKGISLFSGGLDGILAVKLIQEQGIGIEGVTFETPFFNAEKARQAADQIGIPLLVMDITEEYLTMLKAPRYGYGRNMNPCIDCHTLMLNIAGRRMEDTGADFLFTGEVLGQRPMSQTKQSLHIVAKNSGYEEYIVRPLSAKLLPETIPEKEGKIIRQQLLDIQGRGRKRQIELAKHYGIKNYPNPAGGCLLTDFIFSKRLRDLFEHQEDLNIRDFQLLKSGRRIRTNNNAVIIVGRNKKDNTVIQSLSVDKDIIIKMKDFPGPAVLIPDGCDEETLHFAAAVCALYSDAPNDERVIANCRVDGVSRLITIIAAKKDEVQKLTI
ncbi:MAG: tRNA 4-thiouridine(8) synthase ThiI [Syntrophobacterales bacterium]|nr:tRNA 4-thiouridine(8) synthase ThiI [Syntrophobacterales bacterium]